MARPLWAGSLSFGLVNVPVALFTAVRDQALHFHELHESDGARIEQKRFCAEEDAEVPFEEIGHAYDLENGKTVIVTDEELQEVAPRRTRTIDIEAFVAQDEIDPMLFDHPYFLAPTGEADGPRRAYQLLLAVMEESGKVALGRFVMRTKEYLVTIGPRDDRLALTTMRFADEIRATKGIDTRRQEAGEAGARPGRGADRGAVRRLGSVGLEGRVPRPARGRHRAQAQGPDDRGAGGARRARAGARPDGGARGEPREREARGKKRGFGQARRAAAKARS